MRILFLTQVMPYPLDAGPKTRAYFTLRHLAQRHEVTLLSFVRPDDPSTAIDHLRRYCAAVHTVPIRRSPVRDGWHLLRSLAGRTPFLIQRDWVPEMAKQVQAAFTGTGGQSETAFDAIHADQLWMAPYALRAGREGTGARGNPLLVLDQHNAVFQIPRRLAARSRSPLVRSLLALEGRKLVRFEAHTCQQFDRVVWVTEEDERALQAEMANRGTLTPIGGRSVPRIIPICADPQAQPMIQRRPDAHRVTFLGGLHWPPNAEGIVWFARYVWPIVQREAPNAMLTVIGRRPPKALAALASQERSIEVTGYVLDPGVYLRQTAAFVVPLHAGGGMRVKIVDAWSGGLPVVSTRIGAEGLRAQDGENALLADTPEDFARAVLRVLREPGLAARLATSGRRTVEDHYDWRTVYDAWEHVYDRAN